MRTNVQLGFASFRFLISAFWTLAFEGSPTAVAGVFATWREAIYLACGTPAAPAALQAVVGTFLLSARIMLISATCFAFLIRETREGRETHGNPQRRLTYSSREYLLYSVT